MPRKKAPFKEYEGRKSNDKHIRLTADMMLHENYLNLSNTAKVLYSYMKLWACGNQEFEYSISLSDKIMTKHTFLKAKEELIQTGFIELESSGKFNRTTNKYKFSTKWKYYKAPK